jgi:hypothetical protein
MRMRNSLYVAILIVAFASFAQTKQDKIPELLLNAPFIYVEPASGDSNVQDPNVSAEDRQAIADVTKALQRWGHYKVVMHRKDADLVMAVRVGRPASTYVGGKVGASTGLPIGAGPIYGSETGPKQDVLLVFARSSAGTLAGPYWQNSLDHGLQAPDLPLFEQFKKDTTQALAAQKKKTP